MANVVTFMLITIKLVIVSSIDCDDPVIDAMFDVGSDVFVVQGVEVVKHHQNLNTSSPVSVYSVRSLFPDLTAGQRIEDGYHNVSDASSNLTLIVSEARSNRIFQNNYVLQSGIFVLNASQLLELDSNNIKIKVINAATAIPEESKTLITGSGNSKTCISSKCQFLANLCNDAANPVCSGGSMSSSFAKLDIVISSLLYLGNRSFLAVFGNVSTVLTIDELLMLFGLNNTTETDSILQKVKSKLVPTTNRDWLGCSTTSSPTTATSGPLATVQVVPEISHRPIRPRTANQTTIKTGQLIAVYATLCIIVLAITVHELLKGKSDELLIPYDDKTKLTRTTNLPTLSVQL
ncbi:hypothetical protein HDE_09862 [Halotydeus destructor]|nr:hypothetical protein HDE_09862 [Halotydeus destructor]